MCRMIALVPEEITLVPNVIPHVLEMIVLLLNVISKVGSVIGLDLVLPEVITVS